MVDIYATDVGTAPEAILILVVRLECIRSKFPRVCGKLVVAQLIRIHSFCAISAANFDVKVVLLPVIKIVGK